MLALFAQRLLHEARAALASPVPPASPALQPPPEPEPILPLEPFRDPPTPQRPTGPSPRTLSDLDYAVQAVRVAVSHVHTEARPPAERLRELQQCHGRLANLLIRLEELASSPSLGGLGHTVLAQAQSFRSQVEEEIRNLRRTTPEQDLSPLTQGYQNSTLDGFRQTLRDATDSLMANYTSTTDSDDPTDRLVRGCYLLDQFQSIAREAILDVERAQPGLVPRCLRDSAPFAHDFLAWLETMFLDGPGAVERRLEAGASVSRLRNAFAAGILWSASF
eukprot:TRINITY_DN2728_c0_g1_i1.p1 TRINITY_DN2728_c0_g1~~TRINITY_DN2728_c0_g1_i1.p1  ORF type:complete len:295 (-),score=67.60 TRINITY_DN2728_c0_g1_i1:341-1171(-)